MNVTEKLGLIKRLKDVKTQIVESVLNMAARLQLTKELAEIKLKLSVKSDKTLPENNTPNLILMKLGALFIQVLSWNAIAQQVVIGSWIQISIIAAELRLLTL